MKPDLEDLFRREPVVLRSQHPRFHHQFTHAVRVGELTALLPGVYAKPVAATDPTVRALAVCRASPDAILTGEVAAFLGYNYELTVPRLITAAARLPNRPLYRFTRRLIPPEWVLRRRELCFTHPAWTALDLCATQGPRALDDAMRLGVGPEHLSAALAARPGHRGNLQLRAWLAESKDRPFSYSERKAHAVLREASIEGWQGNLRIQLPSRTAILDIGFWRERLGVEIDGYRYHSSQKAFTHDRLRDADLVSAGWLILRVPAILVDDEPDRFANLVRCALAQRGRSE